MSKEQDSTGMRIEELRSIIVRGATKPTTTEVAEALREIRDDRLYRATHKSFDAWCSDVFGISRTRADKILRESAASHLVSQAINIQRLKLELAKAERSFRKFDFTKEDIAAVERATGRKVSA